MNEEVRADYSIDDIVNFGRVQFGINGKRDFTGIRIVGCGVVGHSVASLAKDGE